MKKQAPIPNLGQDKKYQWLNPDLSSEELQLRKDLLETIERANAESDPTIANEWWDMAEKEKHLIDLLDNDSERFEIKYGRINYITPAGTFITSPAEIEELNSLSSDVETRGNIQYVQLKKERLHRS